MQGPGLLDKPVVDFEDRSDEVSVAASTTDAEVLSFRSKAGKTGYVVAFRHAWDSAIDGDARVSLEINGAKRYPYNDLRVQYAPPEQDTWLPVPIPIEQNSRIRVLGTNNNAASGNIAARVIIYYTD